MAVSSAPLTQTAAVFAGGGLGALARAALTHALPDGTFPWTTLAINAVGSFLLGYLLTFLACRGDDVGARRLVRLGVGTGGIGGFTTYSAFSVQTAQLVLAEDWGTAALYALGSVVVGMALAGCGIAAAARATPLSAVKKDAR